MIFDYAWLQSFFKKKLPTPQKLADLLTNHGFETQSVGSVLDASIPPSRAGDCLSHLGLAREISAILNYRLNYSVAQKSLKPGKFDFQVSVIDPEQCPRYYLSFWSDVKVGNGPTEIADRLRKAGQRPINASVDLVNYIMLETGQPVHAFDADLIKGSIEVRPSRSGEIFISLENKRYRLPKDLLVIADQAGPLALAGVKGGKRAEVTQSTKNILIEAANFDYRTVRRTVRSLDLRTEASWRFENGLDPSWVDLAQRRIRDLGQSILKPDRIERVVDLYPHPSRDKNISFDLTWLRERLGIQITTKQTEKIFQKLGFGVQIVSNRKLRVRVPSWRIDVQAPEDLVEEVGRIYGYSQIKADPPRALLIPPKVNHQRLWQRLIKNFLVNFGLNETYQYSFLSERDLSLFGYDRELAIELSNPMSARYQFLRFSLLPNLLRAVGENAKRFNQVELFEMGRIFSTPDQEKLTLAGALIDPPAGSDKFYEIKGLIESLIRQLGITDAWFDGYQAQDYFGGSKTWHPNHRVEIKVGSAVVGFLGEIHPILADRLGFSESVFAFEIDLDQLLKFASEQQEYQPISPYPAVIRDLSVVIPQEESLERVIHLADLSGGNLVRDVDLIDVYQSDQLDKEKSLTLRIVYQSNEKNLSALEVGKLEQKIIKAFQQKGWHLRQSNNA